jgi:nucleotide-binding universal stress UspA family protein
MSYDIIGDVHGHADQLEGLLRQLGYRQRGDAYGQPDRKAIFVGDLIDRGPGQLATLKLVRAMVERGSARVVMGKYCRNGLKIAEEVRFGSIGHEILTVAKDWKVDLIVMASGRPDIPRTSRDRRV